MTSQSSPCRDQRPRELRRRVMLPARVRAAAGWSDVCILNLSSRGMMINANVAALKSDRLEIWHQEHLIVATVVWRKGSRAGLRTENTVPVEGIMAVSQSPRLQLTARAGPQTERRKASRCHDESRIRGRLLEFIWGTLIAASLAIGAFAMIEQMFAKPLASIRTALR